MKPANFRRAIDFAGFSALEIHNDALNVVVVPELGAKIVRLQNLRSGRKWCWFPSNPPELFPTAIGTSFEQGPNAGIDECLPNISPGFLDGNELPCHGEVWNLPWEVKTDDEAIVTSVTTPLTQLQFTRRMTLVGSCLHLEYTLRNEGHGPRRYLWAFHPMLRLEPGDELRLPTGVTSLWLESATGRDSGLKEWPWPQPFPGSRLDQFVLNREVPSEAKLFARNIPEGRAAIVNSRTKDTLQFHWNPIQLPHLGIWINQGAYQGWQNLAALEPTNVPADFPDKGFEENIALPGIEYRWSLDLVVEVVAGGD